MKSYLKFNVNEAKRTVVCIITGTKHDANDALTKIINSGPYNNKTFSPEYESVEIADTFVGIAKCSLEDEFNVETGKLIALTKAKLKYYKAMEKALNNFIEKFTKEANEYLTALNFRLSNSAFSVCRCISKLNEYGVQIRSDYSLNYNYDGTYNQSNEIKFLNLDVDEEDYQEYFIEREPKNYDTLNSEGD